MKLSGIENPKIALQKTKILYCRLRIKIYSDLITEIAMYMKTIMRQIKFLTLSLHSSCPLLDVHIME